MVEGPQKGAVIPFGGSSGLCNEHIGGRFREHVAREAPDHVGCQPASGMRAHGDKVGPTSFVA